MFRTLRRVVISSPTTPRNTFIFDLKKQMDANSPSTISTFSHSIHTASTTPSPSSSSPKHPPLPPSSSNRKEKEKPTHFLAFKITDTNTINYLIQIQNAILEKVPKCKPMQIIPSRFHITLFVMQLPTKDHRKDVHTALEACTKLYNEHFPTGTESFTVKGLGNFQKCRVIYAGVEQENSTRLTHFVRDVQRLFTDHGIAFDTKPFQPHITLFKDKRKPGKRAPLNELHSLFSKEELDFRNDDFGVQPITGIEFVCMNEMDEKGFYKAIGSLQYDTQNNLAKYLPSDSFENDEWENLDDKYNNLFY
eukprot:TRINITY_DN3817_c0_g1_i1.p1 TRINITY_DN3817_c0_g1~~TRINITY_DN3817_c0_g1_i1.p1  ORF type:complete len:306 (+),score=59.88 TRINITY_DN3817_c0_g1_i1:89-1006(+)